MVGMKDSFQSIRRQYCIRAVKKKKKRDQGNVENENIK